MRYATLLIVTLCAACVNSDDQQAPSFLQTGVVEGFYGPPWSHQDRLDILRFMGRVGLTHYYYAPKDDPFHRERWREPYPDEELSRIGELATVADESGVEFVFAISPGGTMVWADSGEYATLKHKIDAIGALGVTAFALFVDDVPPMLQNDADRAAFGSLAQAHAAVINRLNRDLSAIGATLAVTPTTYTDAWGDREYLRELGELVVPEVPFFWTGVDVATPEITAAQATAWADLMSRDPLIWDNYPVNDFARWRPFLGPLEGRGPDLSGATLGILSNPMNEAHASMIPLATLAEYARDPQSYDPADVQYRVLVDLYGEEIAEILEPFVRVYGDAGWDTNVFETLFIPGQPVDVEAIRGALSQLRASLVRLDSASQDRVDLRSLANELRPFVERTQSRLGELETDGRYEILDNMLVFRAELDRRPVPGGEAITIDGRITDWPGADWQSMSGPDGGTGPLLALRCDRESLYAAIRVPHHPRTVLSGPSIGEGDHVALVVQHDASTSRTQLIPDDMVVLVAPPVEGSEGDLIVRSMDLGPFTTKWAGDNRNLRFSEFYVTTFGSEHAAGTSVRAAGRSSGDGYTIEVAVPRQNRNTIRMSLTVTATVAGDRRSYSLAQQNYPANPATYAELVLQ